MGSLPVAAIPTVTINSPANNTVVNPGDSVFVSVSFSGSVAGVQRLTISGERDFLGDTVINYNPSPPTLSDTRFTTYEIPLDATPAEELTLTATLLDFVDGSFNTSITLIAAGTPPPVIPAGSTLVADDIYDACYDAVRNVVYLSNRTDGKIDIYDPDTESIVDSITVADPRGLDMSIDYSVLYVAAGTANAVLAISPVTKTITNTYSTAGASAISVADVAVLGTDQIVVGLGANSGFANLLVLTPSTSGVVTTSGLDLNLSMPHRLGASADDQVLVAADGGSTPASVTTTDVAVTVLGTNISASIFALDVTSNSDGSRQLVLPLVYDSSRLWNGDVTTQSFPNPGRGAAFLPSDNIVGLVGGSFDSTAVALMDPIDFTRIATVSLPSGVSDEAYLLAGKEPSGGNPGQVFVVDDQEHFILPVDLQVFSAVEADWTLFE